MTGTSSQESYELTAGWDTSALQPAPINIIPKKHSSLFVSALVPYIQTNKPKKPFWGLFKIQPFQDAKNRSSRCERSSLSTKLLRYCLAFGILVKLFLFGCWCCFFLYVLFDFICPIELIMAVRVGGHKIPSNYHFHKLEPGEDLGTAEVVCRRKWRKYRPWPTNSKWVSDALNRVFSRIKPPQVTLLHFCPWRQDLIKDKQFMSVWRLWECKLNPNKDINISRIASACTNPNPESFIR